MMLLKKENTYLKLWVRTPLLAQPIVGFWRIALPSMASNEFGAYKTSTFTSKTELTAEPLVFKFPATHVLSSKLKQTIHPPMGFLYHAIKFPVITASLFLNVWSQLKWMIIGALTRLGLYKPPPEEDDSADNSSNCILILDGTSPSLVPIPIHVVTAAIKRRVTVIQYQDFLLKRVADQEEEEHPQKLCTICLEPLEATQEVRDLCRCSHVFHRDCLDTWLDAGQVTCPLCRSMLLPHKTNLSSLATDPP